MCPDALWALFDNPKNTCHFLLCTQIWQQLKTFTILFAMSSENIVSIAEEGSVLSRQVTTREKEREGKREVRVKETRKELEKKNIPDDNCL